MDTKHCSNCTQRWPASAKYCAVCGEALPLPENRAADSVIEEQALAYAGVGTGTIHRVPTDDNTLRLTILEEPTHRLTWHKEFDVSPARLSAAVTPRPISVQHPSVHYKQGILSRLSPFLFFWTSLLVLITLIVGGAFGIIMALGSGLSSEQGGEPLLRASSSRVSIGATLTLYGSHFTPHGQVGLTRDVMLPIVDTGGAKIIQADEHGNFSDTVVATLDWQPGTHTVNTEDAHSHKIAHFSLLVIGQGSSLRPAHLLLSESALDFGSDDIATNTTKTITLTNLGGGQITWQGATNQPWLMISPKEGTFVTGEQTKVAIAADRSQLQPGNYTAQVVFSSNAGDSTLPVKMIVTALNPDHEAVLAINPAVLSFTATDGGASPAEQVVRVSNLGVRPLLWKAVSSVPWLSIAPQSGTLHTRAIGTAITGDQVVTIGVDTRALLPSTYNGTITFSSQGTEEVKDSPQSIYVSVTIQPQCGLQISPSVLSLSGVYQQAAPAAKKLNIGTVQSCTIAQHWSATSNAPWLQLDTTSGTTPATASISINTDGLTPGTYNDSITFTISSGTYTVPVTFTLGKPTVPVLASTSTALTFNAVVGQANPAGQNISISNTGGGTLNWHVALATDVGGRWLTTSATDGTLTAQQTASFNVTASLLNTLVAGSYNGTITITATDGTGQSIAGSPQTIPVSFTVQPACAIVASPTSLSFSTILGQAAPATQVVTITASGTCAHSLNWSVKANQAWLVATPATGGLTLANGGATAIGVALSGLGTGNYQGTLTFTAIDSVTNTPAGGAVAVGAALAIQPSCTLQTPSTTTESFNTEIALNPTAQTFTIGVTGTCSNKVIVTPRASTTWLAVTPASTTLASGGSATFTVAPTTTMLNVGSYSASVSLAAIDNGTTIAGSTKTVDVTLIVQAAPQVAASPGTLAVNITTGTTAQPITISNTGGESLNWNAALASGTPSFVSLSANAGNGLGSGATATVNVVVNASGVTSGTYNSSVTFTATDPMTGKAVNGSPVSVPITISVASPSMHVSSGSVLFATSAGSNPASQSVTITNNGGNTLAWTAGTPTAPWLSVSPASGSDAAGESSTLTLTINTTGLAPGTYTASFVITPSTGQATTVTVALTINAVSNAISVTPTPKATASSNAISVTPTPKATAST